MTFVPDLSVLAAYTTACVILTITPGPDMTLFVGRALSEGRLAGLASMLGAMVGSLIHTMLVAFGLSALIAASASAFFVVKIVGALYLIWIAVQTLRHGSALTVSATDHKRQTPLSRVFMAGLLVNLLNPKIVLFFLTFLPQFVAANDPHASGKLIFLGVFFVVVAAPLTIPMVLMADVFSRTLKRSPRAMKLCDWLFAGIFGSFAVKILLTSRG